MLMTPEFGGFGKIPRWSREVIVTEKIDGTNGQVCVNEDGTVLFGSRNRWLTLDNDNSGFCRWGMEHVGELLALGPGRHFGEWWGQGIQRNYGLKEKRFSLFNVSKWNADNPPPACCSVVPTLWRGPMEQLDVDCIMDLLWGCGSHAADGFLNPEGIIIFHTAAGNMFKKTFEKDQGKG
jgi:hypothetical protein